MLSIAGGQEVTARKTDQHRTNIRPPASNGDKEATVCREREPQLRKICDQACHVALIFSCLQVEKLPEMLSKNGSILSYKNLIE